jgi:glucan phosphoethanolaminetransferase (alkaline phosphatase superfamily)
MDSIKRAGIRSSWGLFLFVPISLLIFSFRQEANMLFGYQINFAFVVTFGVLTLFLLYVVGHKSFKKSAFVAALVSATVATYSVVQGMLVWPVGLLQLFISPLEKPSKRVFSILCGLGGLGVWVAYLTGWSSGNGVTALL